MQRPLIHLAIIALLSLCGCASPKPTVVRLYPGAPRPHEEVAFVSIREPAPDQPEGHDSAVWIRELDGKSCYAGNVEVLPGKHVFGLIYSKWVQTRTGMRRVENKNYARVKLETQANHIYLLHGRVEDNESWFAFTRDVTGKVNLGPEGTILFSKEFETDWLHTVKPADEFRERNAFW